MFMFYSSKTVALKTLALFGWHVWLLPENSSYGLFVSTKELWMENT